VLGLVKSLGAEFGRHGVTVNGIGPGFVRTEMTAGNDFPMPFLVDADRAARTIADGFATGAREIAFPMPMAAAMRIARVLPNRVWDAFSARGRDR
jgi:NAD(P)-dependent dehydrogenase (short-subunit alcohol dehydrogenase family)